MTEPRRDNHLPVLFYAAWPLGYHNPEPERKARALAQAGYRVLWVAGIGTRNPRLLRAGKLVDRVWRRLRHRPTGGAGATATGDVAELGLAVLPPRQLRAMRALNRRWLGRQLRRAVPDFDAAVAWVRWPSQELVDALADLQPRAIVYECVDSYRDSPGIVGRWRPILEEAERNLVRRADVVVTCGEVLADRFRAEGADVRVIPHGVELFEWREPVRPLQGPITAGFVGTLDHRCDPRLLDHIARALPEWRLRLIGPVHDGFDCAIAAHPNVTVEPPVAHSELGAVLAGFDVGLMPYVRDPEQQAMCPVKNLEFLSAGRPAVATPTPALEPFAEHLYFADTPERFVEQLRRAVEEDSPERARRRRAVAERNTWERRLEQVVDVVDAVAGREAR